MAGSALPHSAASVSRQARERFVAQGETALASVSQIIRDRLIELMDQAMGGQALERREMLMEFERLARPWTEATARAWRRAAVPPTATARVRLEMASLELIGDDVVENKIVASRLATAILDKSAQAFNDLKLRMQHLDGGDELATQDVLRPEALSQVLIEEWAKAGLTRELWDQVKDGANRHLAEQFAAAYGALNEWLIDQGVLPDIDRTARVKRTAGPSSPRVADDSAAESEAPASRPVPAGPAGGQAQGGRGGFASGGGHTGAGGGATAGGGRGVAGGSGNAASGGSSGGLPPAGGAGGDYAGGYAPGVADETRMQTGTTPLARARARASGVLGQLRRMLSDRVAGFDPGAHATRPSPALVDAMSQQASSELAESLMQEALVYDNANVEQAATVLRQRTGELKKKASTSSEKATIEIVALMFQSILAEERIPAAVRVWFARLQMPVLRVALAEPEFFGTLQHPARQLIDRMGSCVMGFDATAISGSALETEIKRVVQVIEQYPETGRRVFQLVFDEFQKFLAKFLTEKGATQRLVSVAQQVEQKEAMAIQYTIEMRSMLDGMPVREELREFLFKVWAEVLAVAAIKRGPQHDETVLLKKTAADLVWAASAKPNRAERARVIQELPHLLQRLRQGMTLLGLQGSAQEAHIKIIGDTLADAFMSKTESIPQARIEAMAKRLANLEDFVTDDATADLPLDTESIEMMLGMDNSGIEVIGDGGSRPSAGMLAWAQELQPGTWFTLDHNGRTSQVQYAWCSERKQLHLLAAPDGRSFLIQVRRLAAYLQAGLLVPAEDEALTVRATRDALAKLDANPERLLS